MQGQTVRIVSQAIRYIEDHLNDKLELDIVAAALHYSKFHLHRIFIKTVGLTIHDYAQRRQLTEAAKLLVFSQNRLLKLPSSADMKANRRLQAFSKQCIRLLLLIFGKRRNFTRCNWKSI